jgi:hypothetical protein
MKRCVLPASPCRVPIVTRCRRGLKPISGPRSTSSPRPQQYALARHQGIRRFTGSRLVPSGVVALTGVSEQGWTMLRS